MLNVSLPSESLNPGLLLGPLYRSVVEWHSRAALKKTVKLCVERGTLLIGHNCKEGSNNSMPPKICLVTFSLTHGIGL